MPESRHVEYCQRNVPDRARSRLERLPDTTREKRCLQRCGTCYSSPFVVVDGDLRVGSDHDELVGALGGEAGERE
ncbi:DUF1450 domain-containing protein [Halomontanus rarus]|uniref:DUF1450 domain-containing protein n=1 Tax=Halomontanus rarus TaxID=3034020 RepID=UPI0023E7D867|nr:DUF1450 domain-containing protein [Halovivax sp. TS33]